MNLRAVYDTLVLNQKARRKDAGERDMRIRSAICGALLLALLCAPFGAVADTLTLPGDLKVINSLAYAGLKKDKVIFPEGIEFIADDAFEGAEFVGVGKTGSYAYHWCVNHGFGWTSVEETAEGADAPDGKKLDREANYSGRTTWQRYVQKHYLKATVRNNQGNAEAYFESDKVKYNIRMTLYVDEVYNKANFQTKLNSIEIMLKGWNGPDEEDDYFESFEKDTQGYTSVFRADWVKGKAYNVPELMYDEQGNVARYYDEKAKEWKDHYNHLDLRPDAWDGALISVDTGNNTVSIYHPGDLDRDYRVYHLSAADAHCAVTRNDKNLIIDPATGRPYKKLRVKITASFNNGVRIALQESVIDNVFVNVTGLD